MKEMPGVPTEGFDDSSMDEAMPEIQDIETPTKAGKKLGRRLLRWGGVLTGGLLVLIGFLSATGPGQRVFMDQLLTRIQEQLAGELRIQGIQSGTLFTGATLAGVELDAEDGVHVLKADSIRVRYSPLAWITSELRVSSIIAWGLEFEISRLESGRPLNIQRVVRRVEGSDSAGTAPEATRQPIHVGRIAVREGLLKILTPSGGENTGRLVPSPDGNGRLLYRSL
ncbi:MAG: hypothetical protein VX507_08340, partial [Gemmatimonadota bacterium]|nr:hypothetical protein [Gemmatimonadota bacterium]